MKRLSVGRICICVKLNYEGNIIAIHNTLHIQVSKTVAIIPNTYLKTCIHILPSFVNVKMGNFRFDSKVGEISRGRPVIASG